MIKYNPDWTYVPFQDRESVYCESIKMHNHLWVKPTYLPGEVWTFYGGCGGEHYKIIEIFPKQKQVLVQIVKRYEYDFKNYKRKDTPIDVQDGEYHLYKLDRFGYASRGTPSMRIRIS